MVSINTLIVVRTALKTQARRDLQLGAKALGLKANGTTASLVDSLTAWLANARCREKTIKN